MELFIEDYKGRPNKEVSFLCVVYKNILKDYTQASRHECVL